MSPLRRDIDLLIRLAGPAILGRLGSMAMGLTDTVIVGRYSSSELSHMALGWAPTAVVLVTAMGLLNGVAVLTAQRAGEGRPDLTGAVFRRGVVHALQFGLLTLLALLVSAGPMFAVAGVSADLAQGAARVMRILALSMPVALVSAVCSIYLESLGRPGRAAAVVWVANGLNLVLDLVLVPGGFGLPAMGAEGAALATGLCRLAMLLMLIGLIVGMKDARTLGVFAKPAREPEAERRQRRIGYAAAAAFFVETTAFSGMNLVAAWVGGLVVAGWAIVLNVASLAFMIPLGVSAAASVLVARAHGARDVEGVRRAGALGFGLTVLLTAVMSLGVWLFARPIASAYAVDPALIAITEAALGLSSLFMIADGLQVVGAQMLRARGDPWAATAAQVISYALLMLPLGWAFALPMGLGLNGIVLAALVASLVSASLLVGRFGWLGRRDRAV